MSTINKNTKESYIVHIPKVDIKNESLIDEQKTINTDIPKVVVETIRKALEDLESENLFVTPLLITPSTLNLTFNLMEKTENGYELKYDIIITKHQE